MSDINNVPTPFQVKRRPVCLFTRNPCGTDTWQVGKSCMCDNCQAWAQGFNEGRDSISSTVRQLQLNIDQESSMRRLLQLQLDKVLSEHDELRVWKESCLKVESAWDPQEIGRLLGIPLGEDIRANIKPKIEELLRRVEAWRNNA